MSITTFADLIKTPGTKKTYLVEMSPTKLISGWIQHAGDVYYSAIEVVDITSIEEDGVELTEVDTLAEVTAGKWFHGKDKIYLQASSGIPQSNTNVAYLKVYVANETKIFNGNFYDGILLSEPLIKQSKNEVYYGVSAISRGQLSLANNGGALDSIYKSYSWNNQPITILLGGESLPYSEYSEMFSGKMADKYLSTGMMDIKYTDNKEDFEQDIPTNLYDKTTYPSLDSEDVGRVIALVYGSVFKVPAVCTTKALGSATSLHSFKICDTSVCSLSAISDVYVNDIEVAFQSSSVSTASFKLASGTYSVGDDVTVTVVAAEENPVEQIKSIASNVLSIPYDSDNYDTATVSVASTAAEDYKCGTYIGNSISFLKVIGDLMQSSLGSFFNGNDGKIAINIWDVEIGDDITEVDYNEITGDTFKAGAKLEHIRKVIRVGWRKAWGKDTYSYSQQTSETTEKLYGISRSKTVPTNLSSEASVDILKARLGLIFESETNNITFKSKIQLAEKNIGDRIRISFKRRSEDDYVDWIDSLLVEINSIVKDFGGNEFTVHADDLKGVGASVGHWTGPSPTFPADYGGGDMSVWDSTWSAAQKAYAKSQAGFWCDENGFADPDDVDSHSVSRWW